MSIHEEVITQRARRYTSVIWYRPFSADVSCFIVRRMAATGVRLIIRNINYHIFLGTSILLFGQGNAFVTTRAFWIPVNINLTSIHVFAFSSEAFSQLEESRKDAVARTKRNESFPCHNQSWHESISVKWIDNSFHNLHRDHPTNFWTADFAERIDHKCCGSDRVRGGSRSECEETFENHIWIDHDVSIVQRSMAKRIVCVQVSTNWANAIERSLNDCEHNGLIAVSHSSEMSQAYIDDRIHPHQSECICA
jgi:hypothetical protein